MTHRRRGCYVPPRLRQAARVPTTQRSCTMLILNRRVGESLRISDDIVVTVLDVKGN